jgi:YgiT-type zinc finger domain-containing protein
MKMERAAGKINRKKAQDSCPFCGGTKKPGTTTFTAELGFGVVVVRRVPASVCGQCGADWISDEVAGKLEALVEEAKTKRLQVEVTALG